VECFDISSVEGMARVGSSVRFENGAPDKAGYRRYKIRSAGGQDDYAMMKEILSRRLKKAGEMPMPDLLLIDGGKGHLNAARTVLDELGVKEQDIAAISKGRGRKDGEDELHVPGRKNPVMARKYAVLSVLQAARDEAHRFAISYFRKASGRARMGSVLDEVPGIGPSRLRKLFAALGDIRGVAAATPGEVAQAAGISVETAGLLIEKAKSATQNVEHEKA
jgi:excinuclease ABC subunit C